MKYFILLGVFVSIGYGISFSQKSIIPADGLKSKQASSVVSSSPDTNKTRISSQPENEKNGVQYIEYKVGENDIQPSSTITKQDQAINSPIVADSYTDPNYEINKQKSEELIKQLNTPVVSTIANEELILDLQNKIKAIKDGTNTDPIAMIKLPEYEKKLQVLLNKKEKGSCITE